MFYNSKGFTLVQVLIAAGMLGALSLVFMQLTKNMSDSQSIGQSQSDELELKSAIRLILSDERYCRVSLAGDGPLGAPSAPVTFQKQDIDEEDSEGLDVSLFFSNLDGDIRTIKKFNGQNNPGIDDKSKYGNLNIKSMKLIMNNPDSGGNLNWNYPDSSNTNDMGILRVVIDKKGMGATRREITFDLDVKIGMSTGQSGDASGVSRILSCSSINSTAATDIKYPTNCTLTLSHSDNFASYRSVALDMSTGGYSAIRMRGDVDSNDRFRVTGNCGSGNELTSYISACSIGFGWRDNTDNASAVNATPDPSRTYNSSFNSTITLQPSGDVNEDDSFYFRLRCPSGGNADLNTYVKSKCTICMGHTDYWFNSPSKASCAKIQDSTDNSWGRIMTSGDVGDDDAFFLGFFCDGEYSPTIKTWTY